MKNKVNSETKSNIREVKQSNSLKISQHIPFSIGYGFNNEYALYFDLDCICVFVEPILNVENKYHFNFFEPNIFTQKYYVEANNIRHICTNECKTKVKLS